MKSLGTETPDNDVGSKFSNLLDGGVDVGEIGLKDWMVEIRGVTFDGGRPCVKGRHDVKTLLLESEREPSAAREKINRFHYQSFFFLKRLRLVDARGRRVKFDPYHYTQKRSFERRFARKMREFVARE